MDAVVVETMAGDEEADVIRPFERADCLAVTALSESPTHLTRENGPLDLGKRSLNTGMRYGEEDARHNHSRPSRPGSNGSESRRNTVVSEGKAGNSPGTTPSTSERVDHAESGAQLRARIPSSRRSSGLVGSASSQNRQGGVAQDAMTHESGRRADFGASETLSSIIGASEEPTASSPTLENTASSSAPAEDFGTTEMPLPGQDPRFMAAALEGSQIQAFAKLEFDDGPFYMNTYSVELGRDVRAAKQASVFDSRVRERSKGKSKRRSSSVGHAPQTAPKSKHGGSARTSRSVVSESGGIMGLDVLQEDDGRRKKGRSRKVSKMSRSTSSSPSQPLSRKNSSSRSSFPAGSQFLNMAALSHRASCAHPVNPLSLLPSPEECPLIPIHPPAVSAETGGHRGISRKHVKIAFNFEKHLFELQIKGKNGAFVDDRWHASGETLALRSNSHIQIGGVSLKFVLPDVESGETGAEDEGSAYEEQASGVYYDGMGEHDSEIGLGSGSSNADEVEGVEEDAEADAEDEDLREEEEVEASPSPPPVPKKRGPGRPPKNGKSKMQKPVKPAKRARGAKKRKSSPIPVVPKRKVGRPRKHPLPEVGTVKPEKRKYTKRKGVDATIAMGGKKPGVDGGQDLDGKEARSKEKKEKKEKRPPRSPSPVFDESKLSPEELQKPQVSYVVLIHEALSNSKTGTMSLPQIYRAIERKYPYFKLRVTTTGWQSSVRHNLSQHDAFQKVERDGKGWMWGLVPGVSIEKEKRRKASPSRDMMSQSQVYVRNGDPRLHQSMGMMNGGTGAPSYPQMPLMRPTTTYQSPYATPSASTFAQPRSTASLAHVNGFQYHAGAVPPGRPVSQSIPAVPPQVQQPLNIGGPISKAPFQPPNRSVSSPITTTSPTTTTTTSIQAQQNIIKAVQNFKVALIKSMPNSNGQSEAIVQSAINRVLGLSTKSSLPGGKEDGQEVTIMKALRTIIGSFGGGGSSTTKPEQPMIDPSGGFTSGAKRSVRSENEHDDDEDEDVDKEDNPSNEERGRRQVSKRVKISR